MNHHVNHPEDEYYRLQVFMGTENLDTIHFLPLLEILHRQMIEIREMAIETNKTYSLYQNDITVNVRILIQIDT